MTMQRTFNTEHVAVTRELYRTEAKVHEPQTINSKLHAICLLVPLSITLIGLKGHCSFLITSYHSSLD